MRHPARPVAMLRQEAFWQRLNVLGRSQNWVAREAGISRGYLSMLANGKRAASGRVRRGLMRILEVEDVHELFCFRPPPDEA